MAALIRHGYVGAPIITKTSILSIFTVPVRHRRDRKKYRPKGKLHGKRHPQEKPDYSSKWQWTEQLLSSRGFLRPLKSYSPPEDVPETLVNICKEKGISAADDTIIDDLEKRFELFCACAEKFDCSIPNSEIFKIETVGDLKKFYQTPIITSTPMTIVKKETLPPNLHIIYDYHRFHPDTDTKFGGKTAFPRSSTLVTGLKYKKKYPSLILDSPYNP